MPHAAERPVREFTVGSSGRLMEALDHWLPGLTDTFMGRVLPWFEEERRPAEPRHGAGLRRPSGDALERSGEGGFVRERSYYTKAAMHPLATAGIGLAIGAALALASRPTRRH